VDIILISPKRGYVLGRAPHRPPPMTDSTSTDIIIQVYKPFNSLFKIISVEVEPI